MTSPGPHNEALREIIRARIEAEGPLSFSEFLRLDLYHPEHGYYITSDPSRDYQSSPNVHAVFGVCLARQIAGFWREMGSPAAFTVFEAAAGSGRLAADILSALRDNEPALYRLVRYVTQDPALMGPDATTRLATAGVPAEKIDVAPALPESATIDGCIISNELLDALPFDRVRVRDGKLWELRVGFDDGRFVAVETEPSTDIVEYFAAAGKQPGEGCDAEVGLEVPKWLKQAATALRSGYMLTLDYGYETADLYASWRKRGTLLTFYQQTSDDDPFARIGRQDITASVDFSVIARAGEAAGLRTVAQATQAEFLAALGIGEALSQPPSATQLESFYALRRAAIELTDMSGLGRIRVLIQSKGL